METRRHITEHSLGQRLHVTFFQRRPYPTGHYSLEFIAEDVRSRLSDRIVSSVNTCRFYSRGIWRRVFNIFDALFNQGEINIVFGDIHYVCLLLPKRSTILTILDCGFLYQKPGIKRWLEELLWVRLPVSRVKLVTTISEHTKGDILKVTRCAPSKVTVIPVAIDSRYLHSPKPFNKERPVLLQLGQASNKNLERIIEAVRGLSIELAIIGRLSPQNSARLQKYRVSFRNRVNLSADEMVEEYKRCDILLFPSIFEGFGMPIVEAQAVGRAVLTSNTTSMPWVAGDGACLVDPHSTSSIRSGILKIIDDDVYREILVKNGLENCKRFNPDLISKAYLSVFEEAAERQAVS